MSSHPSRRRFITISAAVAGVATLPPGITLAGSSARRWQGVAMGADAEMILYHDNADAAQKLIDDCISEVHRLERVFSLYQRDSAISKLNQAGVLKAPPPELVDLLSRSHSISELTDGAFDVSVQSLWQLYQAHFTQGGGPEGPSQAALEAARELVDYRAIEIQPDQTAFTRPGMSVTMNGIAQGYITDAVTQVLKRAGATNVLVNMGEIRALGRHADGQPWKVGLGSETDLKIDLIDKAVATSAGDGMVFPSSDYHHLFDPRSGLSAHRWKQMSVIAHTATFADGFSTAFSSLDETKIRAISTKSNIQVRAIKHDGSFFSV